VDTDDVYQSTIAASLADLARIEYRGEKAFVAWLTQVAERRDVDAARRHRAARRDVARERPIEAAADRSGSLTSPTQSAVRGESRADVARAVALLPERERRALELRSVEGRSFQEIADALGLADRHVARKLVQVALMEMGDLLERGRSP
jgi:RNA polymerase sigma-70 factor (ECF subfamily)